MSPTTFVLVHGAFGNAALWGPLTRASAVRGQRVIAVDLPGHGLDARPEGAVGLSTADEVSVVALAVRGARAHGPVVLVGHSRGGLAVTATANAAPELLDHLVYVSAWCCVDGGPSSYTTPEPSVFDALVPSLLPADPAEVGELRVDDDAVRLHPGRAGTVPRTYVRLPADRALLPLLQDRFIAEADAATPMNPTSVVDLPSSHLGVLLDPDPLAEVLAHRPARP